MHRGKSLSGTILDPPGWISLSARLCSPSELRVYDSEGNVTGLVRGNIRSEIPNSGFYEDLVIILSLSSEYEYEVAGTDVGSYKSYNLVAAQFTEQATDAFVAVDIPTAPGVIYRYALDWDALSQGENGVTVRINSDGDGVFEQSVNADNELTHDEFMLQTAILIDFDPDTLNLRSKRKFVTGYIELPEGYDVSQIDTSSIMLNGVVPPLGKPSEVGDYDGDGVRDLMVKFDRATIKGIRSIGDAVKVTVTGQTGGIAFKGNYIIRVINDP